MILYKNGRKLKRKPRGWRDAPLKEATGVMTTWDKVTEGDQVVCFCDSCTATRRAGRPLSWMPVGSSPYQGVGSPRVLVVRKAVLA